MRVLKKMLYHMNFMFRRARLREASFVSIYEEMLPTFSLTPWLNSGSYWFHYIKPILRLLQARTNSVTEGFTADSLPLVSLQERSYLKYHTYVSLVKMN